MEVEKRISKSGFLNLFDWNGKSRRKLFSDNSNRHEGVRQGKGTAEELTTSKLQVHVVGANASSINSGRSDWNCSSTAMNNEGQGTKAPSVVARLMGLDSLPTSNSSDSSSICVSEFHPPRGSLYEQSSCSRYPIESQIHKVQNGRIDRFQNEVLPPKSAKPISLAQHKLLSPIKSPGFVSPKNAPHIIEAAAKIIEASPQAVPRGKALSNVSASVPLRIQDLKVRLETSNEFSRPQQPKKPSAIKYVNVKSNDKTPQGKKAKSTLPSEQATVSVQQRERKNQIYNKNLAKEKQRNESNSNQISMRQPALQKGSQQKISTNRTNNALKQNNQKQNSLSSDRFGLVSKSSGANKQERRVQPLNKMVNKVAVKTDISTKFVTTNTIGDLDSTSMKNLSHKKGFANGDTPCAANAPASKKERSIKYNIGSDEGMNWGIHNNIKGMDVISFTFTSPIKRCTAEDKSPSRMIRSNDDFGSANVTAENSLCMLLEQKLRELKDKVESYNSDMARTDSLFTSTSSYKDEDTLSTSTSSMQDSVSTLNLLRNISEDHEESPKVRADSDDELSSLSEFDCSSTASARQKCQARVLEVAEECSGWWIQRGHESQPASPITTLEPSFEDGSNHNGRTTHNGKEDFRHVLVPEASDSLPTVESLEVEDRNALTYLRTSPIVQKPVATHLSSSGSTNWELDYVRGIISKAELTLEHRASIPPGEVINPCIFDELESEESRVNGDDDHSKLERKVLFDRTNEWLELRFQDLLVGSPSAWGKWDALIKRNRWVAEEAYREISGRFCIGDMMVDVLVDEDMSHHPGKWSDFGVEMFEEGSEIVKEVLSSLVDELVADFQMFIY